MLPQSEVAADRSVGLVAVVARLVRVRSSCKEDLWKTARRERAYVVAVGLSADSARLARNEPKAAFLPFVRLRVSEME